MSATKRKLVIGLATAAGVILAALLLLILSFPTDLIRDRAVAAMEQRLQRPVQVGGAHVTLFPYLGADLTDVQIGEQAEPNRPRIALASLHLRIRLLPLLRREVEITRVEINGLEVEAVLGGPSSATLSPPGAARHHSSPAVTSAGASEVAAAGGGAERTGAQRDGASDSSGAAPASKRSRPLHFKIEQLIVRDGSVSVRAADGKPLVDLGGVFEDLKADATSEGDLRLEGLTRIDSLRIHLPAGDLGQGLRVRLDKRIQYDRSSDSLTVETADLDLSGLPVSVSGAAGHVTSGAPTIDITLRGGPGEVSGILGYLPATMFPQMERIESRGIISLEAFLIGPLTPEGQGPSHGRELDFLLDLTLSEGTIAHPKLREPVEQLGFHATLTPQSVKITDFTALSGASRLKARASISDYKREPSVDAALDADLDLREVAGMRPQPGAQQMQGRAAAQLSVRGPIKNPDLMNVAGVIDLSSVRVDGEGMKFPLEGVSGRILVHDKDLTLQRLNGKIGSSDFSVRGTLVNYPALQPEAKATTPARVDLVVRSGLLALNELSSSTETEKVPQSDSGQSPPSPAYKTAATLAALTGTIDFRADRIRTAETETGAARAFVTLERGLVRIERFDAEVFGGKVAVQGTVDYGKPQAPQFDLKGQLQKVSASDILASSKSMNRFSRMGGFLSGEMNANATIKGDLNETQELNLGSLTSIGDLSIHGAKVIDHPLQVRLADFLETPQLNTLAISDWFQPFRIEEGRLIVDKLSIRAQRIEVSASGWQSLDGKVEMNFDILLPEELSDGIRKQIPKELIPIVFDGTSSQILVPIRMSGSYDAPRMAVDSERLTAAARAQAQKKLEAERQKLEEEARRRAQGFLDDLTKTPADTAAGVSKESEIESKIKKSLKDLFKKKK